MRSSFKNLLKTLAIACFVLLFAFGTIHFHTADSLNHYDCLACYFINNPALVLEALFLTVFFLLTSRFLPLESFRFFSTAVFFQHLRAPPQ
jgi:hypothetical protein